MTVAEAIAVQGDYQLRGPDFETLLVGPVTASIIDADRVVREEWRNGFPNWDMYRVIHAGDRHLAARLRQWCVALAVALAEGGLIRNGKASDELVTFAGWDCYSALTTGKWAAPCRDMADLAEVDRKTYRKLRDGLYRRLKASLDEYWIRLQIAMRQVALLERRQEQAAPPYSTYSLGRGFDGPEMGLDGSGNYITPRRGSGC